MGRIAEILTGQRFGMLTVTGSSKSVPNGILWVCLCDCGVTKSVLASSLRRGDTKSCGCLRRDISRESLTTHGLSGTPEFTVWKGMLQRCRDPDQNSFADYGGRGITVCDEWNSFENFIADMGPRPSDQHTIERSNNNLGYSKSNCSWATREVQAGNNRRTRYITYNGETLTLTEWSTRTGLSYYVLRSRLQRGWPVDKTLNQPKKV